MNFLKLNYLNSNPQKIYQSAIDKTNELIASQTEEMQQLQQANYALMSEGDKLNIWGFIDENGEKTKKYYDYYNSASKEAQDNIEAEVDKLIQIKKAINENSDAIQNLKNSQFELNQSIEDYSEKIQEALDEQQKATQKANEEIADNVISVYKKAIEMKRDLEIAAIEDEMDEEEERHNAVMDNLDEEYSAFEKIVNAKLKDLQKEADAEDYNKQLTTAQQEAQDIQNQINRLSLDDSVEAKAKREELEKELADKLTEISELQTDRERKLRQDNLEDQLDTYKEDIEAKKEAEDKKYNSVRNSLEQEMEDREYYWNEILNDESYFADLREDIINGSTNKIQNKLKSYLSDLKT
jgi:DNA repair exonuclease SbcCD ATPase subunit